MNISRIFDIIDNYIQIHPDKQDALAAKEQGFWRRYTTKEYYDYSYNFSYGLLALKLKKGDKIVTISNNRPEWNFVDMGMCMAGIINVPLYPTISQEDYSYILNHVEPSLLFISDKLLYDKIADTAKKIKSIQNTYTFNDIEGASNWIEIVELGKKNSTKYKKKLKEIKDSVQPKDLATIIYTSGTTGNPKGVMLSHVNILSNIEGASKVFPFNHTHKTLSFLPVSHVFERMVNYYFQSIGTSIYYAENMGTIADNIREVKPHIFITVPRLLERVYDRILDKGKELTGIKKSIFFWAVKLGLRYDYNKKKGIIYRRKLKIANNLVFTKWREALGGNVILIVAGGAALQTRLARVFNAAQIPLVEGYGLSETSPVIAANRVPETGEAMIGTVGPAIPGVEIKIAEDGEILCKGPNVMMGYYKDPSLTKEVLTDDGWFHTGDIGEIVKDKYLKITDRKKEIFKLSSGKYIAPQIIENKLKESLFIEQAMVVGENEKFASALILPHFQYLHSWGSKHHILFKNNQDLIEKEMVIKQYQKVVSELNKNLGLTEQIKRFRLINDEWSPLSGELSPTLKLKRRVIFKKYRSIISEIYSVQKSVG